MCRHAGYVGPGIAISELTHDLPHSLERQSYAARELLTGTVCADGFGVAWFVDGHRVPARYANVAPIWSDRNLPSFGPLTRSANAIAWIRNATVAGGNSDANTQPFVDEGTGIAFTHNGFLDDFAATWRAWFTTEMIPPSRHAHLRGDTDSEHIFHALLHRVEEEPEGPAALATAVQGLLRDIRVRARDNGTIAQLNLLVTDGTRLVASRCGQDERQNSLYLLVDGDEFPDGAVVASEPLYDDPLWVPVETDSVVVLQAGAPPVRLTI